MKIDPYFLTVICPYGGKRSLNTKRLKILAGAVLAATVIVMLTLGKTAERSAASNAERSKLGSEMAASTSAPPPPPRGSGIDSSLFEPPLKAQVRAAAPASRQYSASQIVQNSATGNGLPTGTTIPARLVSHLVSTDQASPAVALITEDTLFRDQVIIPEGSKAFGSAAFDGNGERLQIRFHTLVYPDGSQHQFSALALLPDGSSGLAGEVHSDTLKHQAGSFLSYFVSGLATGLQDRQAVGTTGITVEPGSIRNGLLNGVASSSLETGKSMADSIQKVHPYLDVPAGTAFILYLDREYRPE